MRNCGSPAASIFKFFILYNRMWISLILIGTISAGVAGGTAYLYLSSNPELTQKKKTTILMIVGTVIFLSFLVTTLKHRDLTFKVSSSDDDSERLRRVFFGGDCSYDWKADGLGDLNIQADRLLEMYSRNYQSLYDIPEKTEEQTALLSEYQEILLYLSVKGQGASFFLHQLAKKICRQKNTPVIYLKLEQDIQSQAEFLQAVGVSTFPILQHSLCRFADIDLGDDLVFKARRQARDIAPYLIIDNFEHLLPALSESSQEVTPDSELDRSSREQTMLGERKWRSKRKVWRRRLLDKILEELVLSCRVNIVMNTQKEEAVQYLYELWEEELLQAQLSRPRENFLFQYHRWQGLTQYDLFRILAEKFPGNPQMSKIIEAYKQERYNFRQLFRLFDEIKERGQRVLGESNSESLRQGLLLKDWGLKFNLARYFRVDQAYKLIKSSEDRKILSLKDKVGYHQLRKLEKLGLIAIESGAIYLL